MTRRACQLIDLGLCSFAKAYALQKEIVCSKFEGSEADTLILVEHFPIITLGRKGRRENISAHPQLLESVGIEVLSIDRGGDVTYHGPGQLVGYAIMDLRFHRQDVHWLLRQLEAVIIRSLKRMGIEGAYAQPGLTGVWVGGAKIAAIGIGVSHWITFHGFALNVAPKMKHFELIIPCGLKDRPVTCMRDLLTESPSMDEVKRTVTENFCETFGLAKSCS
ncbi:MAG: lipoyl(octanoyl) transferase LipB [Candidatus Hydrogenedentota bacterium]|nr:MAG: lipoyl(octanoyl) transferase LipB [Candidatus Hydrogenedentota bacterium]